MKYRNPQAGFTLIELLIVMAILAMLAALVGPALFGNLEKGMYTVVERQPDGYFDGGQRVAASTGRDQCVFFLAYADEARVALAVVEPWLVLSAQRVWWSGGYLVFGALVLSCGVAARVAAWLA